jgi:hypothetical protein
MTNKKLVLQLLVVSAFVGTQIQADWAEEANIAAINYLKYYGMNTEAAYNPPRNTTFEVVPLAELKDLNTKNATAPIIKTGNCKLTIKNLTEKSFTLHRHSYATGSLNTDVLASNASTLDLTIGEQYFLLLSDGSKIFIKPTASNSIDSYVYREQTSALSSAVFNTGTMTQSYNYSNLYLMPSAYSAYALLAD